MHFRCELAVPNCPHGNTGDASLPMFSTEYKRSNRTRMAKILRCFPHCCPTHRPRSYCGSALHVQVTLEDEDSEHHRLPGASGLAQTVHQAQEEEDAMQVGNDEEDDTPRVWRIDPSLFASSVAPMQELLVYGRFELHDPDEPQGTEFMLGNRIPAARIRDSQGPEEIWVTGIPLHDEEDTDDERHDDEQETKHEPRQLTISPSSAVVATNEARRQRVFTLNEGDGDSHHWEYDWKSGTSQRKRACQHQFRAYLFLPEKEDTSTWRIVGIAASTSFTLSSYRKIDEEEDEPAELASAMAVESSSLASIQTSSASMSAAVALPHTPNPIEEALLVHQPTVETSTKISMLFSFLSVIGIDWLPPEMVSSRVLSILRSQSADQDFQATDRAVIHFADFCLPPLLAALSLVSPPRPSPLGLTAWYRRWTSVLHLAVDVFCQLLLEVSMPPLQAPVRVLASRSSPQTTQDEIVSYIEWMAEVSTETERVVRHLNESVSLDLLVDEIVSCMYDEDPDYEWMPRHVRGETRRLLRNTRLLGLDLYREQSRQWTATAETPPLGMTRNRISQYYSGLWTCISSNETPTTAVGRGLAGETGFSALTAIMFLVAAQSFEIRACITETRIHLRTAWSFFPELWSVYELDGLFHTSSVMPLGLTPAIWRGLNGNHLVGDYRGIVRFLDDGSSAIDLDLFSYSQSVASYWAQVTLLPTVTSHAGTHTRHLHAHVRVYRGHISADNQDTLHGLEITALSPEERCERAMFSEMVLSLSMAYEGAL